MRLQFKGSRMIKTMLKAMLRRPVQLFKRYRARDAVSRLQSHENAKLKAIGDALYETLVSQTSSEEHRLIAAIEKRRSVLLGSDSEIDVIDFGAGKSGSHRTKEEMETGVRSTARVADICKASKSAFWATLLFKLIRKLEPASCVELGACVGISASYQLAALNINGKGALVTLEGAPEVARIANETIASLGLRNASVATGPFHETLKGVLESARPIDFFFNDGHHDHDAVLEYFNESLPNLANEAVIVFDDISWSPGMRKAWAEIEDDERVCASIDLEAIGIAVVGKNRATKLKCRIPL
jgi:predicted O-methyltransferase YrrM